MISNSIQTSNLDKLVLDNTLVCLDIDTTTLKISLISMGQTLKLVGFYQTSINFQNSSNYLSSTNELYKLIIKGIKQIQVNYSIKLKYLVIGLENSAMEAVSYLWRMKRFDSKTDFNQLELSSLMTQNQAHALKEATKKIRLKNQILDVNLKLLNSVAIGFYLDGRICNNPIGRPADSAGINLYNVFIDEKLQILAQKLSSKFDLELITPAIYKPLALAQGIIGNNDSAPKDGLVIHMEDLTTYVLVIKGGVLEQTKVFDIGKEHFKNSLIRNLGFSLLKVNSLISSKGDFDF